jgi:hypothetical protein
MFDEHYVTPIIIELLTKERENSYSIVSLYGAITSHKSRF